MADELRKSAPPREPLTQIELLITLDRIQRDLKGIRDDLTIAKDNDERFKKLETHFTAVKWFAGIAVGAALVSLVNGIAARMSWHISDEPPAISGKP